MSRNTKVINGLIKNIKTRSAKQRDEVQAALVECAMFVFEDRNTDPFIRLFAAVGGETDRKAMSNWASLNGLVHFKDGKPVLSDTRQKEAANTLGSDEYLADIKAQPAWHTMNEKANTPTNIWDSTEFLNGLEEYLTKAAKKAEKHDPQLADVIRKAHDSFHGRVHKEMIDLVSVELKAA